LDFFTVPTATFRVLFVLVVLSHTRRRLVHFNVTENPTAAWTARQLLEAYRLLHRRVAEALGTLRCLFYFGWLKNVGAVQRLLSRRRIPGGTLLSAPTKNTPPLEIDRNSSSGDDVLGLHSRRATGAADCVAPEAA
jgi:hypothetical protein